MGVLMLVCPNTGGEFSTGIHIDIETFRNLPDTRMNSPCPRCFVSLVDPKPVLPTVRADPTGY